MSTPYSCLRCGHRFLQRSHHPRSLSYLSLHRNIQESNDPRGEGCKAQPIHSKDGPRSGNATKPRSSWLLRPVKRALQLSSGSDPRLEALFSSQQEEPWENSQTRNSRTPYSRPVVGRDLSEHRELAELQRSKTAPEQPDDCTGLANRLGQVITGLQQREKQIADLIAETSLLFGDFRAPAPSSEESITFTDRQGQTRKWDADSKARRVTKLIKNIERATQRYDVGGVAQLWQKYQQSPDNTEHNRNSRETVFLCFLSAFFSLCRREQAIQVWNDMLKANITPNRKHWNAMLKGCSKVHDIASLQEVWSSMVSTGIEPDQMLYTTYIHGLIICGKWHQGLRVLDNLGAKWNAAKKRQASSSQNPTETTPNQPRSPPNKYDPNIPSLGPIQGAITALTVIQRHSLCLPLLSWAAAHSIPLSTEIFNILLRSAVRTGDTKKVTRIFSLMNANNCPADEATYTILLDGHMSNHNSSSTFPFLSPQEQRDSILRILDDMTANKISVNERTYGTILRSLLFPERGVSKDEAARAILAHMAENNVTPDSYIYHMLITYHFARDPPDIAAVEAIWARIKLERPTLQSVFYEKMVEGYAHVRAVERMMFFLQRIAKEGNSPRWGCLVVVLNTLMEMGEWDRVKELVEDVRDKGDGVMGNADENVASRAKEEFWGIVGGIQSYQLEGI
ncbi:MAG: hypothetical protein LQ343_005104 [Gyalolechia ehrenbergii]|nr:MAG: hypothetical protein LQ343_005104 [Gyalolechia ehrenbergii]